MEREGSLSAEQALKLSVQGLGVIIDQGANKMVVL
jgi:hypothetical protein